jgi:hypothetical protein
MLEKEPGNPKIHRLRIIALIESDYNQSQRILLARRLSHRMEDLMLIPDMQYGSRSGKLCITPVLNKQLTHDIVRQTKRTVAVIENDAVGCYDRLMNPLVLLAMRWLGVPDSVTKSVAHTWSGTSHSIKTYFGISPITYTNSPQTPLFGPGQGSTTGPTLWQLSFTLLENSAVAANISITQEDVGREPLTRLLLTSVEGETSLENGGEAFVDDTNLISSSTVPQSPHEVTLVDQKLQSSSAVQNLQIFAQRWEKALYTTGGAINFAKSLWFVFHWKWSGGVARLVPPPSTITLQLTEGDQITPISVPQLSVHDSYRTLGVHISPSGSTKQSFQVLMAKARDYQARIITSSLPREAALLSYNMYLLPKLGYPLPALTFSEADCHRLQSPTLAAFLPKIHLNRHVARSIVFGSIKFGGLGIRSLYSIQSLGQLTLFIGHIRAADKTDKLLRISLSYLQLVVGSATNVLMLPTSTYSAWTECKWLLSFWTFLRRVKLTATVTGHWVPEACRRNDFLLMDYFVEEGLSAEILVVLNRCRIYLQVFSLADISSADGTSIIPDVLQGVPLIDRKSKLNWPYQQRPPNSAWEIWRSALRPLQPKNKLTTPLGIWTSSNLHQNWFWFKDNKLPNLYFSASHSPPWTVYKGFANPRRPTRSSPDIVYIMNAREQAEYLPSNALPATITYDRLSGLTSAVPGPCLPDKPVARPSADDTVNSKLRQYDYFRYMFPVDGFPTEREIVDIVETYKDGIAVVTRCLYEPPALTHGWTVFSSSTTIKLITRIHTRAYIHGVSSEKRNTLECIVQVVYLLRVIGEVHNLSNGTIIFFCTNKSTARLLSSLKYRNVSASLDDDGDLLTEMSYQLKLLEKLAQISFRYCDLDVKTGDEIPKQFIGDLGTKFNPHRAALSFPLPVDTFVNPPNNAVQLHLNGHPLLSKVKSTLRRELYKASLQATISKQEGWTDYQFNQVDWSAHEYAFQSTWSAKRITYTKLVHNLLNTNVKNKKFYGKSDLCPCCNQTSETLLHVFTCPAPETTAFRKQQQTILWQQLENINTPEKLLTTIKRGLRSLESYDQASTNDFDTEVAQAQFELGWSAFLRGRISTRWQLAFNDGDEGDRVSRKWAGNLVLHLLQYSQQLWIFRCGTVHGHNKEESRRRQKEDLLQQIHAAYEEYSNDPFCVPNDWRSLFGRPFHTYDLSDRDTLACWLKSFSEAKQQQALLLTRQQAASKKFFRNLKSDSSSSQDSQLLSSSGDEDMSLSDSSSIISELSIASDSRSSPFLVPDIMSCDGRETISWE